MAEKTSFLFSEYIIDGVRQPLTPARMLEECSVSPVVPADPGPWEPVADETVDVSPESVRWDEDRIADYAALCDAFPAAERPFPVRFPASRTCGLAALSLIDMLWMNGHFRLGDLVLRADWKWDPDPIGNMASFYDSVDAAADYIDALGLKLKSFHVAKGPCEIAFKAGGAVGGEGVDEFDVPEEEVTVLHELPFKTINPRIGRKRKCPGTILNDPGSWLLYIPFDNCEYRLGGSLLAEAAGVSPSLSPDICDADYFIDCFEVVRELVEDGIVKAGVSVLDGGLMGALRRLCCEDCGMSVDIADISAARESSNPVQILFGEVPGVVIQIADIDYDYVDAELLLQDVAYYPLGHPVPGQGVMLTSGDKPGITSILRSLMNAQTSEGED